MNDIEIIQPPSSGAICFVHETHQEGNGFALQKQGWPLCSSKREIRLIFHVHTDDLEAGAVIANCRPASAAEQIQETEFADHVFHSGASTSLGS